MKLKILTPEKMILEQEVDSVTLPAEAGQLTTQDGHDIMLAELGGGRMYCRYTGPDGSPKREDFDVDTGIAEITKDSTNVFVARAVRIQPQ